MKDFLSCQAFKILKYLIVIYLCHLMPAKHVMQKDEGLYTDKKKNSYPCKGT